VVVFLCFFFFLSFSVFFSKNETNGWHLFTRMAHQNDEKKKNFSSSPEYFTFIFTYFERKLK